MTDTPEIKALNAAWERFERVLFEDTDEFQRATATTVFNGQLAHIKEDLVPKGFGRAHAREHGDKPVPGEKKLHDPNTAIAYRVGYAKYLHALESLKTDS